LEDEELLHAWGAKALLLPDDLPEAGQALPLPSARGLRVVVAGSLDGNEPVTAAVEAARLIPDVEVRLTGYESRVPISVRRGAPPNVTFTGWLDYPRFLGELCAANVVGVFSTDPHIMNRSAFEAVGLGRPLVLTDFPGLRSRFGDGALFTPNDPKAMARTLTQALEHQDELAGQSRELQTRLRRQHQDAVARLKAMLEAPVASPTGGRRAEALGG
jgi:glycosyltransferase involved in cell wall biosynthesis